MYRVTPPWERGRKHFAKELEASAMTMMRDMPVKCVDEIIGECYSIIQCTFTADGQPDWVRGSDHQDSFFNTPGGKDDSIWSVVAA